jgi:hypothetical protein
MLVPEMPRAGNDHCHAVVLANSGPTRRFGGQAAPSSLSRAKKLSTAFRGMADTR